MAHDFQECLEFSHRAENLPFWEVAYRKAFPSMRAMVNHREDGPHQRQGVDRSVILANGKQIWIDEKVRGRNKKTGKVYDDIALEYMADERRQVPGWVCKSLFADYIAYAIAPLGKCYMLPVLQLQSVWAEYGELWKDEAVHRKNNRFVMRAENRPKGSDRTWVTLSVPVRVDELFPKLGGCLRVEFAPYDPMDSDLDGDTSVTEYPGDQSLGDFDACLT